MGDAVRRVQKHLQELSRDHLTSVEDRHHANLGWLQIELQQLCKQIEVDVRVELTRPPRLSFSKPNALMPLPKDIDNRPKPTTAPANATEPEKKAATAVASAVKAKTPPVLPSPVHMAATRLVFDETEDTSPRVSKKRRLEETKKPSEKPIVEAKKKTAHAPEVIDVDAESDIEVVAVVPAPAKKRMVQQTVKRTRKVLKPKQIIKTEQKFVKEERPVLPQVDVDALKVVDLKAELKKRGLRMVGVKAVLAARLREALEEEDAAQAGDGENSGTWVTEEVIEEVMEEIEEEYEEVIEIEEEEPMSAHEETKPAEPEHVEVEASKESEEERTPDTQTLEKAHGLDVTQKETERMSHEDVNVPKYTTSQAGATSKSPAAKRPSVFETKPSPKKSLSDMVTPMAADEIVRESADSFISPEGKMPFVKPASTPKSPGTKTQVDPTPAQVDTSVAVPSKLSNPSIAAVPTKSTRIDQKPIAPEKPVEKEDSLKRSVVATTAGKNSNEKQPAAAPQRSLAADITLQSHDRDEKSKGPSTAKAIVQPVSDNAPTEQPNSATKTEGPMRSSDTKKTPTPQDIMTPTRDLLERVKSLASSSRSGSISSLSAARRYTGSMGLVEDSQPDQSPYQATSTSAFSIQSARPLSTSQLEINMPSSSTKTPDVAMPVPPPNERAAQSEPRVHVAKVNGESEAERKRREEQENIQREAQKLRLAMKQSARKRFEESKTTNRDLFWKRDQANTETSSTEVSSAIEVGRASVSPTQPTTVASEPLMTEKGQVPTQVAVKADSTEAKKPVTASTTSPSKVPVGASQTKQSARQAPTSEHFSKKEPEKKPLQARKRSSIVLDTSKSTLYPSKKRVSTSRDKEVELTTKRTSLTKTSSPAENLRKRTSTERVPARTEGLKRKRSSDLQDKPSVSSAATKRKSVSSSQPDQSSARVQASSGPSVSQKTSVGPSRIAVPTSTTAKRRDSGSSTISSSSSVSASESRVNPTGSTLGGGAARKPANLVSGLHSFTSLLEKDSANMSSSQGSNSSSSRQPTGVSALKMAEKSRLLEQKKNLEKAKRKEALAKKYEEQRKADEEKRKKYALMKEKAEREARLKREQEQATEKKQRDLELAKKRQQRLQEMRSGMEKKKAQDQGGAQKAAVPVSRIAGAASSTQSTKPTVKTQQESKEVTTYVMSDHEASSESEDEKDTERNSKNIPKWAQRENLERALRIQFGPNAVDPTPSIFPDFVDSCDLEAIFEPTDARKKKRFQRRTSSGNWLGDRPTAREKAVYKKDMGFQK